MTLSGWDSDYGGGWRYFKVEVPEFMRAFLRHDQVYDEILAGTALKTLKEFDEEFLFNMRRAAKSVLLQGRIFRYFQLQRYARLFYNAARAWAEVVRPEINNWKPGDGPL